MIFDFATGFSNETESIEDPGQFVINNAVYSRFAQFLKDNNFQYESESEHLLKELERAAKEEKYYSLAENDIENLKKRLEPHLDKDLEVFNKEIKSLLKNEIVSRFYYQKGAIKSSIGEDRVIQTAIDKLSTDMAYNSYLEPGIVITMDKK
jgi:carboxyl-terminal processing protease